MRKNNYWYTSDHFIYDWYLIIPEKSDSLDNLISMVRDILLIGKETGMYILNDEIMSVEEYISYCQNTLSANEQLPFFKRDIGEIEQNRYGWLNSKAFAYNENGEVSEYLVSTYWEFMKSLNHPIVSSKNRPVIWGESLNISRGVDAFRKSKSSYFSFNVRSNIFLPELDLWWVDEPDEPYDNTELALLNTDILNTFMKEVKKCFDRIGAKLEFESDYDTSLLDKSILV